MGYMAVELKIGMMDGDGAMINNKNQLGTSLDYIGCAVLEFFLLLPDIPTRGPNVEEEKYVH